MLPHSIILSFDLYDDLLDSHTEKISDHVNRPDIHTMQFERASVFTELKNQLACFVKNSEKGSNSFKEAVTICQERIRSILEKDVCLKRKIADYRCELQHKKKVINKGKIALHGYGGSSFPHLTQQRTVWHR